MRRVRLGAVALPNGVDPAAGVARLSVVLSPRLETDEGDRLDLFPDFVDWPSVLRRPGVRWEVQLSPDGAGPGVAVAARVVSAAPRSELWTALFAPDFLVVPRGGGPAMAERSYVAYPQREVHGYLKERYQDIAVEHPDVPPSADAVTTRFTDLMGPARRAADGRAGMLETLLSAAVGRLGERAGPGEGAVVAGEELPPGPDRDFTQFELFHHRPEPTRTLAAPGLVARPARADGAADPGDPGDPAAGRSRRRELLDFHAALAALGDHPALLRQLGLVVDLELDPAAVPATAVDRPGTVRAGPVWTDAAPDAELDRHPVAYLHTGGVFAVAGRPGGDDPADRDVLAGLVRLGDGSWDLVTLDVDGAGFKALGALASAAAAPAADRPGRRPTGAPGDGSGQPLPALRTAGIALARTRTAHRLHEAITGQEQAAAGARGPDEPFFAEDVTLGYRMDVLHTGAGGWRSLHRRRVSYRVAVPDPPDVAPVADEGFVRRGVTEQTGVEPLYAADTLCRWDGWSLSAPRPGKAVSVDPRAPEDGVPETQPQRVRNAALPDGLPLEATVTVEPGSLPRLRFGAAYQVRLRVVDLAGNSPSVTAATEALEGVGGLVLPGPAEGGGEPYRRFEPLGSPELVARAEVREGESLVRLVIRSDPELPAAAWAQAHPGYLPVCERHVVPPKTSQLMAERHGAFEAAIGTGTGVAEAYALARREKGTLADPTVLRSDGTSVPQQVRVVTSPAGDYVVNREARLLLPYLPDPLVRSAVVAGAPGVPAGAVLRSLGSDFLSADPSVTDPAGLVLVDFPGRWPDREPFVLRLAEGAPGQPPGWEQAARVLTVRLPPAGRARVLLSCRPFRERLPELALRAWVAERKAAEWAQHPERAAAYDTTLALGRSWPVSPPREIELVHAVQRPLRPPAPLRLAATRTPGATYAQLGGEFAVHGGSTDRLDLLADWTDVLDLPEEPGPRDVEGRAHVLEVPIHLAADAPAGGDRAAVAPEDVVPAGEYDEGQDRVRLLAPPPDDQSGRTFLARHELGDTRHRVVRYRGVGTSRFREYFDPALAGDPDGPDAAGRAGEPDAFSRTGEPVEVDVPSSAHPAAPRPRYVVPAFRWERGAGADPAVRVSTRHGGGLRVYLERPWFSSGAGELLAVVLWPDPNRDPPPAVQQVVTRWGRDPIWQAPPVPAGVPRPGDFPLAVATATGLALPEPAGGPDQLVSVAGHAVTDYDPDRRLWSCDIELAGGPAYTPFVRLALARWQPSSLPGLELSRVVPVDFAQLPPARTVTAVASTVGSSRQLGLTVTGPSYRAGPDDAADVDVTVQRRLPGTSGDAGWVDAGPESAVTVAQDVDATGDTIRWQGMARVGAAGGPHRVVIRERERIGGRGRPVFLETVEF